MNKVDVLPVDLGLALRERVQPRLARAPVVVGRPVSGEFPERDELHALRPVGDELPGGPARVGDALPEVGDRLVRHIDPEGTDFSFAGHKSPPPWIGGRRTGRPIGSGPTFHAYGPSPRQRTGWYCLTIAGRADAWRPGHHWPMPWSASLAYALVCIEEPICASSSRASSALRRPAR